ncbi:PilZ domain-containing protein [Rhodobacterales bacterium]|nr:PilZ domain-containing protein [Rhodobacterales bacterium]
MSDNNPDPVAGPFEENDERALIPRERRARVLKKGKMIFENGLRSLPCTVRNISDGGALIEFEQAYLLPVEFVLHIELESYEVTCERRWQDGLRCGAQFISEKRPVGKQREQVLKTSEEALKSDLDTRRAAPDTFYARAKGLAAPQGEPEQIRRARPATGDKPGFGKRR